MTESAPGVQPDPAPHVDSTPERGPVGAAPAAPDAHPEPDAHAEPGAHAEPPDEPESEVEPELTAEPAPASEPEPSAEPGTAAEPEPGPRIDRDEAGWAAAHRMADQAQAAVVEMERAARAVELAQAGRDAEHARDAEQSRSTGELARSHARDYGEELDLEADPQPEPEPQREIDGPGLEPEL